MLLLALGPDPDTFSIIALGRWILDHHSVPTADPFSANFRGTHWVAFEWLSQIAFTGAHAVGGWLGVVALTAAAAAQRHIDPRRRHSCRSTLAVLIQATITGSASMCGAALGLLTRFLLREWPLWRAQRSDRPIVFRQWFSFALLALGAACLNPYGPEMILATFRTVALGAALTTVAEWCSQDFTHLGAFEAIMLGAFRFALYRGVTLPWLRIVMLFGVLQLALSQVCHADLLGMLTPIFLARPLAEQFKAIAVDGPVSLTRHKMWLPIAAVAFLVATTALASLRGIGRQGYPGKRNRIRPAGQGRHPQ